MKKAGILLLAALLLLPGCSPKEPGTAQSSSAAYRQIDQQTAADRMAQDDGHVVVDVRRIDEYESGHIPGAICIPNESIEDEPPKELPNRYQTILLYCRSGNRSKQAAEKLAQMGYDNLYEFGGIIDWTGEVVTGQTLTLTFESNPTTGFSWYAQQDRELFALQSCYVAEPQTGPVTGSGGWQTFILTPKEAGTETLTFTYTRPWEPGDTDPQFTCTVEVSEDLTITVGEDGGAGAFVPVIKIY